MYRIVRKKVLTPALVRLDIDAPLIAKKAQPGQFIILRVDEGGERIPITVHDYDREEGTVAIIVRIVGATSLKLSQLKEGDCLHDFVGPLGKPTELDDCKHVAVVAGGVGAAIAYPVAKKLHEEGKQVEIFSGYRSKDVVVLEDEFRAVSDKLFIGTDDGSYVRKAMVPELLDEQIAAGADYDMVFVVGPMPMMRAACKVTKKYNVSTICSMSPIMVDGTGMCGCCRLSVDGEIKFACVDGPDFDGHKIEWDEAVARSAMYSEWERHKYEETCNLFKQEV